MITNSSCTQSDPSQALARKRRKEILASNKTVKRSRTTTTTAAAAVVVVGSEDEGRDEDCSLKRGSTKRSSTTNNKSNSTDSSPMKRRIKCNAKVIKSNTKYQNRYEPDVPMSKEEEAEWRREARRQRNRESAAASRNKVRIRIQELESEVEDWKTKYEGLMKRIEFLEKETTSLSSNTHMPSMPSMTSSLHQDNSRPVTIQASPMSSPQVAPKPLFVPSSISVLTGRKEQFDLSVPLVPDCADSNNSESSSSTVATTAPTTTTSKSNNQQINVQSNVTQNVDLHVINITSRPAESR